MMARILFTVLLLAAACTCARGEFGPWDGEIAVGDAALGGGNSASSHSTTDGVVNGMQGGAYLMIRFFQVAISPQDGPNCMFRPVCSVYGRTAVAMHGALLGSILAGDRILRCNHFNRPADDPVPASILGDR